MITLRPERFRLAIAVATPGSSSKSSHRVTYCPSGSFRLITPSRSRKTYSIGAQLGGLNLSGIDLYNSLDCRNADERAMTPAATLSNIFTPTPQDHLRVSRRLAPSWSLLGQADRE